MKFSKEAQLGKKKKKGINLFKKKTRSQMIKELDKITSLRVRENADWTCERCKTPYKPPTRGLQCSHYFSRRYIGTRFNLDNLMALCYFCHQLYETDKQGEYTQKMKDRIGEQALDKLRIDAYSTDSKMTMDDLKKLLLVEELKGNV